MDLIYNVVQPPGLALVIAALGAVVGIRRRRLGRFLIGLGLASAWVLSTSACGTFLLRTLQTEAPLDPAAAWPEAGAVVVLSAGAREEAPEYGGISVDPMTLERLRYGAFVQRRTGVPLLVTGGPSSPGLPSVAELMRRVAADEFGVKVAYVEGEARTTWENATKSAALLKADGIERVYLVSHAYHLPRGRTCFEEAGLEVIAAPTGHAAPVEFGLDVLLPSRKGVRDASMAVHEWVGRAVYALRRWIASV